MTPRINSKNKGNKAERVVAKLFEDWTGEEWCRVPQSGGLQWSNKILASGDIMMTDPLALAHFPFSIEVKFYKEITFQDLILPNQSTLQKFYTQSQRDGESIGKLPLVMFRYNRMPKNMFFVMMDIDSFDKVIFDMDLDNGWFNYADEYAIFTSDNLFETNYRDFVKSLGWKRKPKSS